jgi:hypothetical protein
VSRWIEDVLVNPALGAHTTSPSVAANLLAGSLSVLASTSLGLHSVYLLAVGLSQTNKSLAPIKKPPKLGGFFNIELSIRGKPLTVAGAQ